MRAAAEMKKQMAPQGGNSGRGMMGIVLPMYAVGIVVYLIYTLSKVPKYYIHYFWDQMISYLYWQFATMHSIYSQSASARTAAQGGRSRPS